MIEKTSPIARFLVVSAAFVVVVSGLKMAGPLLVPFLLAVFIAMIVSPLLAWLKNRRVLGGLAIMLKIVLVYMEILVWQEKVLRKALLINLNPFLVHKLV